MYFNKADTVYVCSIYYHKPGDFLVIKGGKNTRRFLTYHCREIKLKEAIFTLQATMEEY